MPHWPALRELPRAAEQLGVALDEGEPLALGERLGHRLAVQLVQLRLRLEQFELARAAGHEQEDDGLGLRRGSAASSARAAIGARLRRAASRCEQRAEGHRPDADAAVAEEVPPRVGQEGICHGFSAGGCAGVLLFRGRGFGCQVKVEGIRFQDAPYNPSARRLRLERRDYLRRHLERSLAELEAARLQLATEQVHARSMNVEAVQSRCGPPPDRHL